MMSEIREGLERTYREAVERFMLHDALSVEGHFLGLGGAPGNNMDWYAQRERFANWLMGEKDLYPDRFLKSKRSPVSREAIAKRIESALATHGYSECEFFNKILAVVICESRMSNAGYGRDRRGTSNACGIMQTKWSAVMDGGYRYENYLDIVFDRYPLIAVDAGVGYFLRMFARTDGTLEERLDLSVCGYNRPGTTKESNHEYFAAVEAASEHILFARFCK